MYVQLGTLAVEGNENEGVEILSAQGQNPAKQEENADKMMSKKDNKVIFHIVYSIIRIVIISK